MHEDAAAELIQSGTAHRHDSDSSLLEESADIQLGSCNSGILSITRDSAGNPVEYRWVYRGDYEASKKVKQRMQEGRSTEAADSSFLRESSRSNNTVDTAQKEDTAQIDATPGIGWMIAKVCAALVIGALWVLLIKKFVWPLIKK